MELLHSPKLLESTKEMHKAAVKDVLLKEESSTLVDVDIKMVDENGNEITS